MMKATTPISNANKADNISTNTFRFFELIRLDLKCLLLSDEDNYNTM